MFCFVAFAVLAILGLFSSTHRVLAKEAFGCIGRRVTLRPCDTGFQEKVQGQMIGFLMRRSVTLARLVRKHFEALAWIFFILTVWSVWVSIDGLYNFYRYGSCDGLNESGFCVLDPTGRNTAVSDVDLLTDEGVMPPPCEEASGSGGLLSHIPLTPSLYPQLRTASPDELLFIGCFECHFTRQVFPTIERVREQYQPNLTFIHHPVFPDTAYLTGVTQCVYDASAGDEWWSVLSTFFATDAADLAQPEVVEGLLDAAGYDGAAIMACAEAEEMRVFVRAQRQEVVNTGLYGTPLIFVNETAVVGPKPFRVYRLMLEEAKWWPW